MPVHNADIIAIFEEIASLLEIEGANPFRIRAYHNGALILGDLAQDVRAMVERDEDLTRLPGHRSGPRGQDQHPAACGTAQAHQTHDVRRP